MRGNLLLMLAGLGYAAWVVPLLPWVARTLADDDGPLRAIIVAAGCWLARESLISKPVLSGPSPSALAMALVPPLLTPAVPSLETAQVLLAVATGYGLVGLITERSRWRRLGPLALLVALAVPATVWLDVALGWPLRKAIASIAAAILGGVPVETVIRVEGGIAHVDLPCAGVRSLWTGVAMMLLWALARGRAVDGRWVIATALATMVAVMANTARVVVLVGLAHVWGLPLLAESVHVPLGMLGFVLALAAGVAAGEGLGEGAAVLEPAATPEESRSPSARLSALPALALVVPLLVQEPAPPSVAAPAPVPSGWQEIAPSPVERAFADEHGAAVTKAQGPGGASVVLVASGSWLAHHVPEQCLLAHGWRIAEDHPAWIDGVPVRLARVRRDGQDATAIWWFQRGEEMTDDLVVRIRGGGRWVLVSVLVPGEPSLDELAGLLEPMRLAAASRET